MQLKYLIALVLCILGCHLSQVEGLVGNPILDEGKLVYKSMSGKPDIMKIWNKLNDMFHGIPGRMLSRGKRHVSEINKNTVSEEETRERARLKEIETKMLTELLDQFVREDERLFRMSQKLPHLHQRMNGPGTTTPYSRKNSLTYRRKQPEINSTKPNVNRETEALDEQRGIVDAPLPKTYRDGYLVIYDHGSTFTVRAPWYRQQNVPEMTTPFASSHISPIPRKENTPLALPEKKHLLTPDFYATEPTNANTPKAIPEMISMITPNPTSTNPMNGNLPEGQE